MAKPDDKLELDDRRPLTMEEISRLRHVLLAHERSIWLWTMVGFWVKWIFAGLAAAVALKVLLGDYLFRGPR